MLFEAIERGDTGSVWQQVQQGIRFDQTDESTELTPLGLAAEAGHVEIVRTLLSAGANPDLGGATTPLEAAVVGGHHEVVQVLLNQRADVNKAVEEGFTPLMTAATTGDLELVQMLLNAGARPQAKNEDGDTAATLAEDAGYLGVAAFLRARRAKTEPPVNVEPINTEPVNVEPVNTEPVNDGPSNNGKPTTPPQHSPKESFETTNSELAAIMRETELLAASKSAAPNTAVPNTAATNTVAVESTAPEETDTQDATPTEAAPELPNTTSEDEHPPLEEVAPPPAHLEAEEDIASPSLGTAELQAALDHLRKLSAQGAGRAGRALREGNPAADLIDPQGFTLLMAAAQAGEPEIVRLLLSAGADSTRCDATDDGFCALVWAVRSPSDQRIEVIKALVEAGADPNQRCGPNERTPLMFAAQADVYLDRPEGPSFGNTTRALAELGAEIEAQDRRGLTVWRLIKRDAIGAPTFGSSRRRLHQMVRLLEYCGAQPIESHAV